ncbi:MAG: MFS transporter [Candidatus Rokuibacteriota bacterium]|nr:MAG: MFS transporter [Candidatus Rokubacteria bacterium]
MTSENGATRTAPAANVQAMSARYFYGWNVVGATFVMALLSFGLGFYGLSVYVATLQRLHGWSASAVSAPVTVYYVAGAVLTAAIGDLYERFGPRAVVAGGSVAMAAGVAALGVLTQPWQLYPTFLVMSLGWGAMSGAAVNIILAPWFQRRRGLVVSIAFNGATLGGVIIAPALILLIGAVGFTPALEVAALVLLVVLVAVAAGVMRRGPEELGLGPDGDPPPSTRAYPEVSGARGWRGEAVRTWRFWSVSAPFALGLTAQVGVLTHLVALVTPMLGAGGAARAVSATTAAALIGRLVTGFVVDRLNRRLVSSATLVIQIIGLALLAWAASPMVVYAGCALFGLGVGNLTTLPGLILAVEWPREQFSALVGLVVGINQFTFAFGPSLVGVVRDWSGTYGVALGACTALQAIAAALVLLGPSRFLRRPTTPRLSGSGASRRSR